MEDDIFPSFKTVGLSKKMKNYLPIFFSKFLKKLEISNEKKQHK